MRYKPEYGGELEEVIREIAKDKNKPFLREFLADLLSPAEYKELAVRWQIVKLLEKKVPHRDIAGKLKVGVSTVTRGSRELMQKKGGFRLALDRLAK